MAERHPDTDFAMRRGGPANDPNPLTLRRPIPNKVPTTPPDRGDIYAVNSQNKIDLPRLRESMDWSSQAILPFRQNHADAIKYFAGSRYGRGRSMDKTPINMMKMAVDIWSRHLVSQDPRCLVLTRATELRLPAYELELAVNHLLGAMDFGAQLSSVVRSAIFTMGVMKVGLTEQYMAEAKGIPGAGGQPYAEPVLFEDWLHDMNARRIEECEWYGNRYRVPYANVMDNPDFNADAKAAITKGMQVRFGEGAWGAETRRESDLSTERSVIRSEYREHVELWDIYFPSLKLLITMCNQPGTPVLQEREWVGPSTGPFHIMTFSDVPGNLLPAAPAQHLFDMQDLLTRVFNQLGRQALRQKTLTIVDGAASADGTGERVMEGNDGQVIMASNVDGVRELKYGGIDPGNMQFAVWLKEMMSYIGGNLDSMGGLAQQGKTLGQEQLLAESSSDMLRDMQSQVLQFTKKAMTDVAWYMYTNPVDTYRLEKTIEGFGNIPFEYGPEKRDENFYSYHLDIQPFSLQSKTPQERLQSVMQIVQDVILPLAPQLAEWGITLNLKELVDILSKYSDLPELTNVLSSQVPLQGQTTMQPGGMSLGQNTTKKSERPLQSPNTTRNYVRENVSTGGTQNQREGQLMQALAQAASKE
jgi:hypothetical protein